MTDAVLAPTGAAPPMPLTPPSAVQAAQLRYSCRSYRPTPLSAAERAELSALLATATTGPFGARVRFRLLAAEEGDASALRGLGTYGFIKGAPAFIVGALARGEHDLEDYGYALEQVVLQATALGLGTCWLGGSFDKSRFAQAAELAPGESLPAVAALGHPAERAERGLFRLVIGARARLPFEQLFFDEHFAAPLTPEAAGPYAAVLATLRLGPSASNKQPWRVVRQGQAWHLFLRRTPGYHRGSLLNRLFRMADLQRVDMGIAMCHFELAARELGLDGRWSHEAPPLALPEGTEYSATWRRTS
jgi:nitroreductase